MKETNEAAMVKLVWRGLTNTDSIWAAWMKNKYLLVRCFWDVLESPSDSVTWKKILRSRPRRYWGYVEMRRAMETQRVFGLPPRRRGGRIIERIGRSGLAQKGSTHAKVADFIHNTPSPSQSLNRWWRFFQRYTIQRYHLVAGQMYGSGPLITMAYYPFEARRERVRSRIP